MILAGITGVARHLLRIVLYGAIGVVLTLLVVFIMSFQNRPDLELWHTVDLDEEFTADSKIDRFEEYLALEDRLFTQLEDEVISKTGPVGDDVVNRYKRGSLSDPERWTPNWNRTYEWRAENAQGAVLLLHGLSDSPYSLRHLGRSLNNAGMHTLGLRLPGHGTTPSGLVAVRWQDMAAAVELAVDYLARHNSGKPLYVVGYSNGAALAIHYALTTLSEPQLPKVDRLVLISPQIAITSAAAFAVWQGRLGWLLGLEKLAWNDVLPEYDPFKYGSFAINAGDLSYRITRQMDKHITELEPTGLLDNMPPTLAFTSVVDATVLAPALVHQLYNRLTNDGNELVLFDINDPARMEPLFKWNPDEMLGALREVNNAQYELSVITNANPHSVEVIERLRPPGQAQFRERALGLAWPDGVYSLSHVALPFPPDDPLYGGPDAPPSPGVELGAIALRGERNVLLIPPALMLRQRWNPFYPYLEERVMEFVGAQARE